MDWPYLPVRFLLARSGIWLFRCLVEVVHVSIFAVHLVYMYGLLIVRAVGVVTGATLSSLIAQLLDWPWCFWIMSIATSLICLLSYFVVPADKIEQPPWHESRSSQFDLLGALTGVGGLILINFSLNQAPITGWDSPYIGTLLGIGVLLICAFVYIELRVARYPLVPLKGIRRDAGLTLTCVAAGWGSHGIWSYYMFLLVEEVRNHTPLAACAEFWPVAPIGLCAALAVGLLLKRLQVAHLMSIAMLCFLLGCLFLATAPAKQGYFPNTFLSVVITPFGMNWSFPTAVILMSNAVTHENQGIAASLVSTVVNYSISTGLGFAGSIDRHVTDGDSMLPGYRAAWYFGVGLASVGLLISLSFMWQSRSKK
jgi:MFS family permease